ncbi:MAG: hypothetical protein ACREEY_10830 [Brevundimonas sp.]
MTARSASTSVLPAALAAVVLLSGCATGPRVEAVGPGVFSPGAGTYRLADPVEGEVVSAVKRQLAARGWRESATAPDWIIDVAYGVRPQKTGAYTDEAAREGEWTTPPVLPQWWANGRKLHVLALTLNRGGAQPGLYEATARTAVSDRKAPAALDALAEAVVAELPAID